MIRKGHSFQFLVIGLFIASMAISYANFSLNSVEEPLTFRSTTLQTRTDQWIVDLQANYNNPYWFYSNLNTTDRLMIRQAIDYAIPRNNIIKSDMNGFASQLATYELPQDGIFFNKSITPLGYNIAQATTLLNEVFGYTYSPNDNPNTPYDEAAPYFPMFLMVQNTNPIRIQSALIITVILQSIGIGITLVQEDIGTINNSIFPPNNSTIGWDYYHGGFDGVFMNWNGSNLVDDG